MKIFLTEDFFPTIDLTQRDLPHNTEVTVVNLPGNPDGRIRFFSNIRATDISPQPFIPREKLPERAERSTHGGWIGKDLLPHLKSIDTTYSIEARIIADNYKTDWKKQLDSISISSLVEAAENDDIWP